jgi:predicted enzyme related to lactoylglutathione lyase
MAAPSSPVVHLELRTANLPRACGFYTAMFGWRVEKIELGASSYLTLGLGNAVEGGVAETEVERSLWLPYVQVEDVAQATERARELGAEVSLEPREGPAGWRSVIATAAGAELALWQPKR